MSSGYVKLFDSILDSTVWQEDLHVKVVWITMLAMKGPDGIVEAAVPGLAKRAGVTIAQCEDALAKFLSPDPYSRSRENEGRRIAEVDGGWEILNHDKYREKLDHEDQKRKGAERQQRLRDKRNAASRSVTPSNAASRNVRHSEAEADPKAESEDPEGEHEPVDPDEHPITALARPEPPASPAPDSLPGGPGSRPDQDLLAPLRRTDAHVAAVGAATKALLAELNELRASIAAEYALADVWPVALDDLGMLRRRLREDPDGVDIAAKKARHVLAMAAIEARATRSVRWLGGQLFGDSSWSRALRMTPADAKRAASKGDGASEAPRYRLKARSDDDMPPLGPALRIAKGGGS